MSSLFQPAFDTSINLRGVPSGLVASKVSSPWYPTIFLISRARSFMVISLPLPILIKPASSKVLHQVKQASAKSSANKNSRKGEPLPQMVTDRRIFFRFMKPADHCRQHMRILRVIVIIIAIQIGWHNRYVIAAVLRAVCIAHFNACYFGNGIRLVSWLKQAG
jgi:hypothetical protein